MKYIEMNINNQMFGVNYLVYDWREINDEIHIYLKSKVKESTCPKCSTKSSNLHAVYERTIQMIPINMKPTYAHVKAYKYNCLNSDCDCKVFAEKLPFALPSQVRSIDLTQFILATSIFLSNEGASKVLALLGVKVSNDTIKRIYDCLIIEDFNDVESVGIDDVAIRKGQTYATAIYNSKDRSLIALLDGRDAETLKKWLISHDKIKLIARDRASAYAKAINEVLPDCVQVADRFHLLQNLIDRLKDVFKEIPNEIFIKNNEVVDHIEKIFTLKISTDSPLISALNYNDSIPVDEEGKPIEYDDKNSNRLSKEKIRQKENRKKNKN